MLNNIQISQKKGGKGKTKMKNRGQKWKTDNKIMDLNLVKSVITYNVNGLNLTIRRQRLLGCIKKDEIIYCVPKNHFKYYHVDKLKRIEKTNMPYKD